MGELPPPALSPTGTCVVATLDSDTTVHVSFVSDVQHLGVLLLLGRVRVVCQYIPSHGGSPHRPIYQGAGSGGWYKVEKEGDSWGLKVLFDKYHQAKWTKEERAGQEVLVARVEDMTALFTEEASWREERPVETWVFYSSGRRETEAQPQVRMAGRETQRVRFGSLVRYSKDLPLVQRPQINFRQKAPIPGATGSTPERRLRKRFDMWSNAGRPYALTLRHYKGYGLKVTVGKLQVRAERTETLYADSNGLPSNLVSTALVLNAKTIWVGFYDAAPVRLNTASGAVARPKFGGHTPSGISLIESFGGYLWIGTFSGGLYVVNEETLRGARVEGIPDCRVSDLQVDTVDGHRLWVATSVGLFVIELDRLGEAADGR